MYKRSGFFLIDDLLSSGMVQFTSLNGNNSNKVPCPIRVALRASSSSIVHGCPGVPQSVPRIDSCIELRPINGVPFFCRSVGIELRTIQKVSVPSTIGTNDTCREYKIYEEPLIFSPPIGEFHQELLAVDIPILIPLPRDIISSGQFPHWNASTVHKLLVKLSCGTSINDETNYVESFPVVIKLYDSLPLYRQFNEPIIESKVSNDHQIVVDLSLPISSVGPKDGLVLYTKVLTNTSNFKINKKLKLKQITMQIKEILECHEGGLPLRKEYKLFSKSEHFEDQPLNSMGISKEFELQFPLENDYLQMYSSSASSSQTDVSSNVVKTPTAYFNRNKNFDAITEGIPITHTQGFSTLGRLFSIRYEIIFKVKLIHGKDMDIHLPLTVSTYDRISSDYLLNWIMKECKVASDKFGKATINTIRSMSSYHSLVDTLRRFNPPPIIYRYTKTDWVRLGFNAEAFGPNDLGKDLVVYID